MVWCGVGCGRTDGQEQWGSSSTQDNREPTHSTTLNLALGCNNSGLSTSGEGQECGRTGKKCHPRVLCTEEDVASLEFSYFAGWEKTVQPLWKTIRQFLLELNIYLPYESAIPLQEKWKHIHTKKPVRKCVWQLYLEIIQVTINRWMKKQRWSIQTLEYYSAT